MRRGDSIARGVLEERLFGGVHVWFVSPDVFTFTFSVLMIQIFQLMSETRAKWYLRRGAIFRGKLSLIPLLKEMLRFYPPKRTIELPKERTEGVTAMQPNLLNHHVLSKNIFKIKHKFSPSKVLKKFVVRKTLFPIRFPFTTASLVFRM